MILHNGQMRAARMLFAASYLLLAGPSLGEDSPSSTLPKVEIYSPKTDVRSESVVIHTTVDRRPGVAPAVSRAFLLAKDTNAEVSPAGMQETAVQPLNDGVSLRASESVAESTSTLPPPETQEPQRLGQEKPVLGTLIAPSGMSPLLTDDKCEEEQCRRLPDLRTDIREFPAQIFSDTRSLFTISNGIGLGLGAGLAAIAANNWDQPIRENTADHPRRWGGFNNVFDVAGHPATAGGIAAALYTTSLITDDPELHDFSCALVNSLILTNITAVSLKYAFDTTRPNGESHGFPSGHTASAFAVAAVVQEYQGGLAATAAYAFAGLVAWQRIDDRKHDLSDVLFGMALGEIIGRSVARNHRLAPAGFQLGSYFDGETGTTGVSLYRSF